MAASVSVGAASSAVAARGRHCTVSSSVRYGSGPSALKHVRWGQACRLIQVRCCKHRPVPSLGGRRRHSRVVFASRDEIPSEILEDSKFVPLTDEDPRFGPPAVLLLGFSNEEAIKIQDLLKEMEGDFMKVLLCTEEMAKGTLGKNVDAVQPNLLEVKVAKGLPRISFLSGLTGEEIMMLIQIFPEAGLEPTVFAAHVPLNSDKSMAELMEEIMDDHRRLSKKSEQVDET